MSTPNSILIDDTLISHLEEISALTLTAEEKNLLKTNLNSAMQNFQNLDTLPLQAQSLNTCASQQNSNNPNHQNTSLRSDIAVTNETFTWSDQYFTVPKVINP